MSQYFHVQRSLIPIPGTTEAKGIGFVGTEPLHAQLFEGGLCDTRGLCCSEYYIHTQL